MSFQFDRTRSPREQAIKAFAGMDPAEMVPVYKARYMAVYGDEVPPNIEYRSRLQMTGLFRCLLEVEAIMEFEQVCKEVA